MEPLQIVFYVLVGGIILFGGLGYLYKARASKKTLVLAEDAKAKGDDKGALELYINALWWANEKPALESSILGEIRSLYDRMNISYDLGDYQKLVEQYRALSKKTSRKALKETVEVQKLKKALIEKMPGYVASPAK